MAVATATTNSGLHFRVGDFETLTEGLDYAAKGETGYNFFSPRGELIESQPYSAVRDQALELAQGLVRAGYREGSRFAIVAETTPHFPVFFYACQYAGLIPVPMPLHIHMGGRESYVERLRGMLRGSGAVGAVASEEMLGFLKEAALGLTIDCGTPDDFLRLPGAGGDLRPLVKDGPCYIQYSSGSTSAPKGVLITQGAITSNARAIARHGLDLRPGDRSISWLPLYHDMGLVGFCITPMLSQVTVDYLATASFARRPLVWLKLLTSMGDTISFSPTFGYELCTRRGLNGSAASMDLSSWRVAGIGGEMVRADILNRFADIFGQVGFRREAFLPSYGLAESTLAVSFSKLDQGPVIDCIDRDHLAATGEARPAKVNGDRGQLPRTRSFLVCGGAMPEHDIEIRDDNNQPQPDRIVGRVIIRGPSVMAGYFGNQQGTMASMTPDGWLDTGDLGYMLDGQLVISGRRKDLVIHNGRNIWPQDVEWAVEKLDSVRVGDVACFSVGEAEGENTSDVVVVVQCRLQDEAERAELRRLVAATVHQTAGINCQVLLAPTRSLTFTSSGKLSRAAVKRDYLTGDLPDLPNGEGIAAGVETSPQAAVAAAQ